MGPKLAPQGHIYAFSTHFGALEHVHVVQICIMHIKFLETQLMYKKGQTKPEIIPKFNRTLLLVYVTSGKKSRQEEATNVVSSTKVTRSLLEPRGFL